MQTQPTSDRKNREWVLPTAALLTLIVTSLIVAAGAMRGKDLSKVESNDHFSTLPFQYKETGYNFQSYNQEYKSGDRGKILVAKGHVSDPAAKSTEGAIVLLEMGWTGSGEDKRKLPMREVSVDANGSFEIYADQFPEYTVSIWAATKAGMLCHDYFAPPQNGDRIQELELKLRGGTTELHILDRKGKPIPKVSTTVYLSGSDDMSEIVPRKIQNLLRRKSNWEGIVTYPSRLGDHYLGFEVQVGNQIPFRDDNFSGSSVPKVIVVGGTPKEQMQFTKRLASNNN